MAYTREDFKNLKDDMEKKIGKITIDSMNEKTENNKNMEEMSNTVKNLESLVKKIVISGKIGFVTDKEKFEEAKKQTKRKNKLFFLTIFLVL